MMPRFVLILSLWLAAVPIAAAQTPFRYELLHLVPDDFAVCVVVHDLRGHSARWKQSDWLKRFREAPVGKSLLEAPEWKQLDAVQADLKKHLDLDWPTLRDDILGDTIVLAHTPSPTGKANEEDGILLIQAAKTAHLARIIDRLNEAQLKSGELKSLTSAQFKGVTYQRRDEAKKSQFYFVKGSLLALTMKEESLHRLIERGTTEGKSAWPKRFEKAKVERALVTLCVNPRALDREIVKDKKDDPLPSYWRALDAIFVTLSIRDDAELRVTLQADADKLPKWARPAFTHTIPATELWQRFPEPSVFTMASMTDFAGTVEALKGVLPEKERQQMTRDWAKVGALLGLDVFKELLPNIGPDWGVCLLPAKDAQHLPPLLIAVAAKPGSGPKAVDQELFKAMDFPAKLAILQNPEAIRFETIKQGKVDVKVLTSKLFPAGLQPACALKDGYFLLASSPDAIAEFRLRERPVKSTKESTLIRVSTPELAKLLEYRREHVLHSLTDRQQMTADQARQNVENVIALLRLFEHVTLSQHGEAGQATWVLRLTPR